jgi:DNA uptake protein ComE-like DNA-binding protein
MVKFIRLPVSLLALTIAAPVLAQPATPASPTTHPSANTTSPAVKSEMVDLNTATATELKSLPGISEADANKIIQNRPYTDKNQLVSKKVVSETTYDKIKDRVVAHPKS